MNILRLQNLWFALSGILVLGSIALLVVFGLKPGIDFTGGSLIELSFTPERPSNAEIQSVVSPLNIGDINIQQSGEDAVILRTRFITEEERQQLLSLLRERFETSTGETERRLIEKRVETIGGSISQQLRNRSVMMGIVVSIAIVLFVAFAFRTVSKPIGSWVYGIIAVVALLHDVLITIGAFSFLGYWHGIEIGTPFVVALLTILGYSVNDTIVVFDRIRENLIHMGRERFEEAVGAGISDTLVRSFNTSLTTILVLLALFFYADGTIRYFALALIIGITAGTYSSVFLASPMLVRWYRFKYQRS